MAYKEWELEHAARNVAANSAPRHHDENCRKPCNCSLIDQLKVIILKRWKDRGLLDD